MKKALLNKAVLLSMVVIISAVFLLMIRQFLMSIFMAGLFASLLSPVHRWLTRVLGNRKNLASVITIIGMVCLVLVPLSLLVGVVVAQAVHVGQSVSPWIQGFLAEPSALSRFLEKVPYYETILPYRDVIIQKAGEIVGHISTFLIDSLSSVTKVTINAVFGSVIMLYVLFYFLSMGHTLLYKILYFLPLEDRDEQRLLRHFTSVASATIKSTMIIGMLQGGLCGLAFALAGIEAPVFWGTVMAVMSIIPAFGTAIIWAPAVLILALGGNLAGVVILVVICGGIAGNLDNVLRPKLVGKDTQMHDLLVLFGTLGGITMFGLLGIVIGPIIAALFMTIWEIYGDSFHEYLPAVGDFLDGEEGEGQEEQEDGEPS